MKTVTTIILIATVLTMGTAWADDENLTYEIEPEPDWKKDMKSPGTATAMSVTGFFLPVGMMFALAAGSSDGGESDAVGATLLILTGSIFGPGLGHVYAGNSGQFWKGAGLRTLGFGGFLTAVAISWDNPDAGGAAAIAVGSAALYLVSSIHDMATADDSARKYNERLAARHVTVAPTWSPEDNAMGFSLALGF